ncbi:MAG: xylulokinase [Planctomycetota bacterium]
MLIGIDIGTSGTKAVAIGADGPGAGRVLGVGSSPHELLQPKPGWTEQSPLMWWRATCAAVREAVAASGRDGASVTGIGFSGQMHGSVFLDQTALDAAGSAEIEAIRPALLWNDQRTAAQCMRIEEAVGGRAALVDRVGNAALTGFTAPKILWFIEHEPELAARVTAVCLPKDYVRLCMTGELFGDVSDCAGTLVFDPVARTWADDVIAALGMAREHFPDVVESAAPAGRLTAWGAGQLGLSEGAVVAAGAGDNQAGAVGAGVAEPGMVLASLGTSGVIYAHAPHPMKDVGAAGSPAGRVHTMCSATGDVRGSGEWSITGCMLSAAGALAWARETIAPGMAFDELLAEAEAAPAGCEGLAFLPYLTGERCPHPDPAARGGWIGLTGRHGRGHLIRAVIEGVTFGMGQMLEIVRGMGVPIESVRLSGGGNKSEAWRQVQADVYAAPVVSLEAEEGPAFGGALLGGVAAGVWPNVAEACSATIRVAETREPGAEAPRYAEPRAIYASLYETLRETMHRQSAVASGSG